MLFASRSDAGRQLAAALAKYARRDRSLPGSAGKDRPADVIVLALPRGGLAVGFEIAHALSAPLSIVVSKKIAAPDNEEYAVGAVSHDGAVYLDDDAIASSRVPKEYIDNETVRLTKMVSERFKRYTGSADLPDLTGKIVILTDDGVATGSTMFAALAFARSRKPRKMIVAIPVGPPEAKQRLEELADEVVCLAYPDGFSAVGEFYEDFPQVEDDEAIGYLARAKRFREEGQVETHKNKNSRK